MVVQVNWSFCNVMNIINNYATSTRKNYILTTNIILLLLLTMKEFKLCVNILQSRKLNACLN